MYLISYSSDKSDTKNIHVAVGTAKVNADCVEDAVEIFKKECPDLFIDDIKKVNDY